MKKILTFTAIFTVLAVSVASAGIFGKIGGFVSGQAATVAVTAILSILGTFGASYKLWGKVAFGSYKFIKEIMAAVDPDGEDGKKVNAAEMERIISRFRELTPTISQAYASTKRK